MQTLLPAIAEPKPQPHTPFRQQWMAQMHIPFEANRLAVQLGSIYSRALNVWGVEAQRMGRLEAAGKHFADAQDFGPQNVIAAANSEFNRKLRAGERVKVEDPAAFEDRFGKYNSWQRTLEMCGPFDDATGCLAQGIVFERGYLRRQAAQKFLRVLELAPDSLLARLWLARVYLGSRTPEKALPLIDELKARSSGFADAAIIPSDMVRLEIQSDYVNKRYDHLHSFLRTITAQKPPDKALIEAAAQTSVAFNAFSNAVPLVNKLIEISPDDPRPLISQGFLALRMEQFSDAIAPLSRAISLAPTNTAALLYRAVAYLRSDKLDESQHDYETLAKLNPAAYQVYYGLAEVATHKKDTNAAIHYYQIYLTNMVPNSPEQKFIADRIKNLKTGLP
jgi:tetratricopeptide (TPR) repeat protein